jgi:hypothetical protein|tara:strand:+ start:4281 stop:9425 length:5145 start_codon:yes stop_codon:yes gene_type:complete
MALTSMNFIGGKMNKSVDERLIPDGEYIDALNVRLGSTEGTEIGAVENSKGNTQLTSIDFAGTALINPTTIGAFADGVRETIYWFVAADNYDMIVSFHTPTQLITQHVVTLNVLNFNPKYLVTGVSLIENLLFFTDDFNPPRKINITRNYEDPTGTVDGIIEEDISVVLKPPGYEPLDNLPSPSIELLNIPGEENYLEDRFISFAYRYRYLDKEYSAISLFTVPAFQPGVFSLDPSSYNNNGMQNLFNSANVTFDTGSKRVLEIDVLYKLTTSSTVYVIERFVKRDLGWGDFTNQTILFTNSKIYTTLGSDELLRLYDNVPRLAKAQTIMANRLVYGNNVDGYNISTAAGETISQNFITSPLHTDISSIEGPSATFNTGVAGQGNALTYSINPNNPTYGYANSTVTFDLSNFVANPSAGIVNKLVAGTQLTFNFSVQSQSWVSTSTNVGGTVQTTCTAAGLPIADCSCYPVWTGTDSPFDLSFTFRLDQDYSSVFDMVNSAEFQAQVGTEIGINVGLLNTCGTSTQGTSMADRFNCNAADVPQICAYSKYNSSINDTTGQQGFNLTTVPSDNTFSLQLIAMNSRYVDGGGVTHDVYEFFEFINASYFYINEQDTSSLHSNRDYETGIVYMDEFARASTVLVSLYNTVYMPPATSVDKNQISVSIPTIDQAPYWANSYKFVVKPSATNYETIYVNFFYVDPLTNVTYFKLEGDNQNKVETGQTLIVKKDTNGALSQEIKVTVLAVEAEARNFLNSDPTASPLPNGPQLPGLYMQLKTNNFSAASQDGDVIGPFPTVQAGNTVSGTFPCNPPELWVGTESFQNNGAFTYNRWMYRLATFDNLNTPSFGAMTNIDIPSGSVIQIRIRNNRRGRGNSCNAIDYVYDKQYVASQDYATFSAWWFGDNIQIDTGIVVSGNPTNTFFNSAVNSTTSPPCKGDIPSPATMFDAEYRFIKDPNGIEYLAIANAIPYCQGSLFANIRTSKSRMSLIVYRADNAVIFETEPTDADPNLFYDSSEKYPVVHTSQKSYHATGPVKATGTTTSVLVNSLVDSTATFIGAVSIGDFVYNRTTGNASNVAKVTAIVSATQLTLDTNAFPANLQNYTITRPYEGNVNQDNTTPATVILPFANCYCFGNGVESFKIKDALDGRSFQLGERVLAVSNADFKEADRFAGLTYSGVFSGQNNLNNLNEFNLGLANFKDCETSFGPIQYLYARRTDVLTLQEDRITYVMAGKNILTDAVGGGLVTSVPEVLGEQVARPEEYGMSFNPESFAAFGTSMYFTDTKRGAVLKLTGVSPTTDSLDIISQYGMRSWFRDQFAAQLNTQKLGGFDPYMNEFVLNSNTIAVPVVVPNIPCDQSIQQTTASAYSYTVDAGEVIGTVSILLTVAASSANVALSAEWNGNVFPNAPVGPGSYTFIVNKTSSTPTTVDITITPSGTATWTSQVKCPPENLITVTQVVLTTAQDAGKYIHSEYYWTNGTVTSPISSAMVTFGSSSTVASLYFPQTGIRSLGIFPYNGVNLVLRNNKINFDDFDFVPTSNKFMWLSTNTVYQNTASDIQALLGAAATITPNTNPSTGLYEGTVSAASIPLNQNQLYLIQDLRTVTSQKLCYSAVSAQEACCDCNSTGQGCVADPACCFGCTLVSVSGVRTNFTDACNAPFQTIYYHSGITTEPVIGDIVYSSSICDQGTQAGNGYYKMTQYNKWMRVDGNGIIINIGNC